MRLVQSAKRAIACTDPSFSFCRWPPQPGSRKQCAELVGDPVAVVPIGASPITAPLPRGLTWEGVVARGVNPEVKSAVGDRQRRGPADRITGSPLQLQPDEGPHEFLMPLEVCLAE
ncbi:hypothetical protein SKAU_G00159670 [Synaphobranchus kaupii]|uniref:Uncharacterized protein n=1 Tax=Synaphobranchus kaupii TaxID=118154 RepID=A0A9Q1FIQ2_SYNKA|nr:hypothetical protein SKAU_G00159670 [Synaphobranchus kaupii]